MPLPAEIEAGRVRLRRPVPEDADAIFRAYAQDALVCRYLLWQPHASAATTRQFIAGCIEAWSGTERRPYVITKKLAPSAIGMIEARLHGPTVDLGYVLARTQWGKGFMGEAIASLAEACLGQPEVYRVQAFCDTENVQSQRVLENAGFRREGCLERWAIHPNLSPEPRACFMYARAR